MRIVDAVKGPFFPADPPFPTFLVNPEEQLEPQLYAPAGDADRHNIKEPEDAY